MSNQTFLTSSPRITNHGCYEVTQISTHLAKQLIDKVGENLIISITEPHIAETMSKLLNMEVKTTFNEIVMDYQDVMIAYDYPLNRFFMIEKIV